MNMNKNRTSVASCLAATKMRNRRPRVWVTTGAWLLSLFLLLHGISARAGDEPPLDLKQAVPEAPPPSLDEPWKFTLGVPGWLAGVYGDIGVKGSTSTVEKNFAQVLPYIDFATSVEAGVQKGKFGAYGSLLYMSMAGNVTTDGILAKADLRVDEYLADVGVSYRIVEGPHGWLDALAGVRYTNLYQRVTLHPNYGAIDDASAQIVDGISKEILKRLSDKGIADQVKALITQKVLDRLQDLGSGRPDLPIGPIAGGDPARIKDILQRIVQRFAPDLAAAVQAQVQAQTAALKATAQQKVDSLKNKLAEAIAAKLGSALDQRFTKNKFLVRSLRRAARAIEPGQGVLSDRQGGYRWIRRWLAIDMAGLWGARLPAYPVYLCGGRLSQPVYELSGRRAHLRHLHPRIPD